MLPKTNNEMNLLQKRIINKHLSAWRLRKRDNEIIDIPQIQTAKDICLFVSCQNDKQWNNLSAELEEWQKTIQQNLQVFCFVAQHQHLKNEKDELDILLHKKHLSFFGTISNPQKDLLQNKSFDMLLLFDTIANNLFYYFQSFIKANIRIGNNNDFITYMDFSIHTPSANDFSRFIQQTEKYLNILLSNK